MIETRSCPSCFKVKRIPVPLPVCQSCIRLVPAGMQAAYVTAVLAENAKDLIRLNGEVVTAAWSMLDKTPKGAPVERGAR